MLHALNINWVFIFMLNHLAIIMDGNGRWAKQRHLPKAMGHKKGGEAARGLLENCVRERISYLTLYAFSSENWQRPEDEVEDLMNLLRFYLEKELQSLHKEGVRLRIIGDRTRLAPDIIEKIAAAETLTVHNTRLNLQVAVSYGSRQEIVQAALKLAQSGIKNPSEEDFSALLYMHDIPDPDLLIRTGGEQRISNFLLWQLAYTELYFTRVLWPDFGAEALHTAIQEFKTRDRRYGKRP